MELNMKIKDILEDLISNVRQDRVAFTYVYVNKLLELLKPEPERELEEEVERLNRELSDKKSECDYADDVCRSQQIRAEKAESDLAALKKRIEEGVAGESCEVSLVRKGEK